MKEKMNVKKVNLFNAILVTIFSVVLTLQSTILLGKERGLTLLIATGAATLIVWGIVLFKLPQKIAAVLIPLVPLVSAYWMFSQSGGSDKAIILIIITYAMAALYFDHSSLIIYGVLANIVYLLFNFVFKMDILGTDVATKDIIIQLVMSDIAFSTIFFLTKWGNEYIQDAMRNEQKTHVLLKDLEIIMDALEEMTSRISDDLNDFRLNIEANQSVSDTVMLGMNDMSKGVEEAAMASSTISEIMKDMQSKVIMTNNISKEVETLSREVNEMTRNSEKEIMVMNQGMETIHNSVEQNLDTVKELDLSMEEIDRFLSAITNVAAQTNLLALNASIEAARAGEAGRGFSIVAEEIRKLSEESSSVANEIGEIVNTLRKKTEKVIDSSVQGTLAVKEGNKILNNLRSNFESMIQSFDLMQNHIKDEYLALDEITASFSSVQENLENNSAIMEEQSATAIEITSSVEEQNTSTKEMVRTIANIERLGNELKHLAKRS